LLIPLAIIAFGGAHRPAAAEAAQPVPQADGLQATESNEAVLNEDSEVAKLWLRRREYSQAETSLRECLARDPTNAECHLWLGSVLARSFRSEGGEEQRRARLEEAAAQYREFLRLAPAGPEADRVKSILQDFEAQPKTLD